MEDKKTSPISPVLRAAARLKWPAAGLALALVALYLGALSHRSFRTTILENFLSQQAIYAKSLENSIRDHMYEEEEDVLHAVREIKRAKGGIEGAAKILPELASIHLDSFEGFGVFDWEGRPLFTTPERLAKSEEVLARIKRTIIEHRKEFVPFLSESYIDYEGKTSLFLLVPFKMPGRGKPTHYAVAAVNIEDYMFAHFPAWKGRSLAFVLADAEGDILSMLNTEHETDEMMKRGNLLRLDSACLGCHRSGDFDDIRLAALSEEAIHSTYRFPGRTVTTNRTTLAFTVYNEHWTISIYSPFESIQRAIDGNAKMNLALTSFVILMMGFLGFLAYRSIRLEEIAGTAEELRKSQEVLSSYAKELEDANHIKDLFTDIVSHDLLNPVSIVKGYASILSNHETDPSQKEVLASMMKSLEKVTEIIENSSTISKLREAEKLELRYLDLGELVENAIGSLASQLRERGVKVVRQIKGSAPVMGTFLLENVVQNLISNAVKFTAEGETVEISIRSEDDSWQLKVKDWGEGIPDKYKELVFTRLERLDKAGIKGTGLGLAIVKRTVQLHGGAVWIEDNPEGGSIFIVSLPKAGTEEEPAP